VAWQFLRETRPVHRRPDEPWPISILFVLVHGCRRPVTECRRRPQDFDRHPRTHMQLAVGHSASLLDCSSQPARWVPVTPCGEEDSWWFHVVGDLSPVCAQCLKSLRFRRGCTACFARFYRLTKSLTMYGAETTFQWLPLALC
jgi:hypothetical protein